MSRSVLAPADTTAPARPAYVAGLDLGQSQDFSALAIVEHAGRDRERPLLVRHLHRWPLGTRYPAIVEDVAELLARPPLAGAVRLAVDKTGVGAGIVDLLRSRRPRLGCRIHAVTITAGSAVTRDGDDFAIPKRELVAAVQAPLQAGRLRIAAALPEAGTLRTELENFRARISVTGHDSYGAGEDWRLGSHDDLVLATAMALWMAEHGPSGRAWAW